jgi:hypothetical protein
MRLMNFVLRPQISQLFLCLKDDDYVRENWQGNTEVL